MAVVRKFYFRFCLWDPGAGHVVLFVEMAHTRSIQYVYSIICKLVITNMAKLLGYVRHITNSIEQRVLLKKLIVVWLDKKFPVLHGTIRLNTIFTRIHYWTL